MTLSDGWVVHEVTADVRVRVAGAMPPLPADLDAAVTAHWEAARQSSPGLFNGHVFSVDAITPELILGHWTEFRRVVAQMREPGLHSLLRLRQLAVCGAIRCKQESSGIAGTLLGRREASAVYMPGMWQLPPAGSVDKSVLDADGQVVLQRQLLTELQEELGVPGSAVLGLQPLCIVEHPGSHVLDLGFAVAAGWTAEAILAAHAQTGNAEYDAVRFLPLTDVEQTIDELGESLMTPAKILLRRMTAA